MDDPRPVAGSAAFAGDCRPASIAIGIVGVEAQVAAARIVDRMALAVSDSVVIGAVPITLRIPVEVALQRDESVKPCARHDSNVRPLPPRSGLSQPGSAIMLLPGRS